MSLTRKIAIVVAGICLLCAIPWEWLGSLIPVDAVPLGGTDPRAIPAAKTPHGRPLSIDDIAGRYDNVWVPGAARVTIKASGSWSYSAHGCMGSGIRSHGTVTVQDGRLLFEVDRPFFAPRGKRCAAIPVWWGDTVFLLGKEQVVDFCNAVNWGGSESLRMGQRMFFVRDGCSSGGALTLPDELRSRVLGTPIRGRLGRALAGSMFEAGFGKSDGVFVGMRLHSEDVEGESRELEVVSVSDQSCLLKVPHPKHSPEAHEGLKVWCDAKGADLIR